MASKGDGKTRGRFAEAGDAPEPTLETAPAPELSGTPEAGPSEVPTRRRRKRGEDAEVRVPKRKLTVSLEADTLDRLNSLAIIQRVDKSDIVQRAIANLVKGVRLPYWTPGRDEGVQEGSAA